MVSTEADKTPIDNLSTALQKKVSRAKERLNLILALDIAFGSPGSFVKFLTMYYEGKAGPVIFDALEADRRTWENHSKPVNLSSKG